MRIKQLLTYCLHRRAMFEKMKKNEMEDTENVREEQASQERG